MPARDPSVPAGAATPAPIARRVYLRTFGCRANQYDSDLLRARLEGAGLTVVASPDEADVAVFNACTVTAAAAADVRRAVRGATRANPSVRSVVMGCTTSADRRTLRALPTLPDIVDGADVDAVAALLALPAAPRDGVGGQRSVRALLRVQDGCDEHCTFCATTVARGANRSRSLSELIDEAARLADRHPEVGITGVHIGSYGLDCGSSLGELLGSLVAEVPDVRFRLSSLEATEVDPAIRALMRDRPDRVAPHLHAPLQSGSDRTLRRMGRHWYTARSYASAIEALVAERTVFGLGADVIAGFPGETEADHAETLALVDALPFTYLHVFPFSLRPGTPAARLPDHIPGDVVKRRAAELRALAERKSRAYRASRDGQHADVVAIGAAPRRDGITEDYLSVTLADPTVPRGSRVRARLTLHEPGLVAHPLDQDLA